MDRYRTLLYISLFISFLVSMRIWFAWNKNASYINPMLVAFMLYAIVQGGIKLDYSKTNILAFVFLAIAHIFVTFNGSNPGIRFLSPLLPTFFITLCLSPLDKRVCLQRITKWFTWLLIPSVLIYFLLLFIDIPSFGKLQVDGYNSYLPYDNYFLFVKSPFYAIRFSGPFMEPGHLGMMIAFLLFANRFDFHKWEVIVLSLINLLTFSLAGYVLFVVGYLFVCISDRKVKVRNLVYFCLFLSAFYLFSLNYNGGKNLFNEKIVERLQYDRNKGITGNNRVFGKTDKHYRELWKSDKLWNGYDRERITDWNKTGSRGSGYKIFIIQHGLIGLLLISLFYIYFAFVPKYFSRYSVLFLLFVGLAFIQRGYPFWTSWIMCYVWGIASVNTERKFKTIHC